MADNSFQFGKTALQKIIYILEEVFNVPCGYNFSLYTYGPFSSELAGDLDYLASLKGVSVSWANSGGYHIAPGAEADYFIKKAEKFLEKNMNEIDRVLNYFGEMNAKDLELRATIIFVFKNGKKKDEELVKEVSQIKPYFSIDQIRNAVDELKEKDFLSAS
jgi:uncharacterized protein YwgA